MTTQKIKIDYLTVVTGLPRSGTSMLMRMLATGGVPVCEDEERVADADNPHGYFEHESVKKLAATSDWLRGTEGSAIKIIAHLLHHIPAEMKLQVLFIDREIEEVLASQQKMIERLGTQGAAIPSAQLKAVFQKQLATAKEYLSNRPKTETLYLNHREIIQSPLEAAKEINLFLGSLLDESAIAAAVDPNLYRNRS